MAIAPLYQAVCENVNRSNIHSIDTLVKLANIYSTPSMYTC